MKRILWTLILTLVASPLFGATTYYKRDSTGTVNWNDVNSWSTVSSASAVNAGTYPQGGDTVFLDAGSTNCVVNTDSSCAIIDCTGYTKTLSLSGNMTTSSNVTFVAGMTFVPDSARWTIAGNCVFTSAGKSFYDFRYDCLAAGDIDINVTLVGNVTLTHDLKFFGHDHSIAWNGADMYCSGGVDVSWSATTGTNTLYLNGTGTFKADGANGYLSFNVNINTAGAITYYTSTGAWIVRTGGTFTYVAGTVSMGTSSMGFANCSVNSFGTEYWNFRVWGSYSATVTLTSDLHINGSFTGGGGGSPPTFDCGTHTIHLAGDFIYGQYIGTPNLFTGNSTWIFDGNTSVTHGDSANFSLYNVTIAPGATLRLSAGRTITANGTFNAAGTSGSHVTLNSLTASSDAYFKPASLGTITYVDATDINSTGVGTITTTGGSITRTTNWLLSNPNVGAIPFYTNSLSYANQL